MAIEIQEKMTVHASPDVVWAWLLVPENVVGCLPGARLVEVKDRRNFVGQMKVKMGTVSVTYKGDIAIVEQDDDAMKVVIEGKWKERAGAGSAKMKITGQVAEGEDGASDVTFDGSATVVGRLVQFGRGMVDSVAAELFKQFADKASSRIEASARAAEAPAGEEGGEVPAPVDEEEDEEEALSAFPLLLKAIWSAIKRFFARLFGRG